MREMEAHGVAVGVPPGWEGAIYRRPADPGEITGAVVHLSSRPLPAQRGDMGGGVVGGLGAGDAFISLFEHDPACCQQPLFAGQALPASLRPADFDAAVLARRIPGQAGVQRFGTAAGRAFALYVVVGSLRARWTAIDAINAALSSLVVRPQ